MSLFAGCGGSSLGYAMAGFKELLAVEWDKHAVQVFSENFPDVPVFMGDIKDLKADEVFELAGIRKGELDVLDGSPPCQGFSMSGKRRFYDPRNELFKEFVRLLSGLQPLTFIMENVSGMVRGPMKVLFVEVLKELEGAGYRVCCRLIDSQWFGVPQRRQRLIFTGIRDDLELDPTWYGHPHAEESPVRVGDAIAGAFDGVPRELKGPALDLWNLCKPGEQFSKHHPKGSWFDSQKLNPLRTAPTIKKTVMVVGASGLFHWSEPRVLSIGELKRVCSFPDEFVIPGRFAKAWNVLGNSVPPLMMRAVARNLRARVLWRVGAHS